MRWSSSAARFVSPLACACMNAVLEHPGFLETVRGPPMQLRDRVGFAPCELRPKHVAEQMVVAVPLALTIERDQEEVLALDRLEGASGAGPLHDRVAHRPVEAIEDRGPDEEALPVPGEGPEDFGADVVDDEAIVAGEPDRWQRGPPLLLQGQRGEVQADRPSLGRVGELGRLGLGGPDPGTPKEPVRLRAAPGQGRRRRPRATDRRRGAERVRCSGRCGRTGRATNPPGRSRRAS